MLSLTCLPAAESKFEFFVLHGKNFLEYKNLVFNCQQELHMVSRSLP